MKIAQCSVVRENFLGLCVFCNHVWMETPVLQSVFPFFFFVVNFKIKLGPSWRCFSQIYLVFVGVLPHVTPFTSL